MTSVVISGASSGFGAAMARHFHQAGYQLILGARRLERLQELKNSLGEERVFIHSLDVTSEDSIDQFIGALPTQWRPVGVLINNAGLALGTEPAHACSLKDWQTMISTNTQGLVNLTRKILPEMVEAKSGMIINIGSIAGNHAYRGGNVYGATKAFVEQFSRCLRSDLVEHNVKICNIAPGLAETEFSEVRYEGDREKAAAVYRGTQPLSADDIAETALWVAQRPAHVNINQLEIMPTCQASGGLHVHRQEP